MSITAYVAFSLGEFIPQQENTACPARPVVTRST